MRVRDLGALAVAVGTHEQPVVGTRGAAMLALLTIHVNSRVSVDALMEAAWGCDVTAGAASTLESHVWRLRKLLEPDRDRRQAPSVLVSDANGYRLVGGPASVDSLSFAESAREVRDLLMAGHAASAIRRAESALALWRGKPYGAFGEADWAAPAVARLEELRGQLQECRIAALVASGALDVALSDLQPLVAEKPFRESLRGLQMEALHRSGRTEQALQTYQAARRTLLDEVGIEPGFELQELHRRILRNDPSLARPIATGSALPREVAVDLPPALTPLVGREAVLQRLTGLVSDHRLLTVTGAAGCGKTRVAAEVARSATRTFPDGVWFVDLTAVSDPDLVVDVVVSTIGLAASAGATPLQDLRRYLQTRRMLLVLDNCEHVLPGVAQIVYVTLGDPGVAPECCFLTTSREPLGIDGETIWKLDPLGLPATDDGHDPSAAPAVQLFLQRLAAVAPTLRVDEDVLGTVVGICVAVDGLPLALELAAARALSYTLKDIAAQVTSDPSRLARIGRGPPDHRTTLRSAIEWSHQLLTPAQQYAHRRLSVLPGPFTLDLAAAVIGDPDRADVGDLLAQLVHRSLLSSEGAPHPGRPTAFRQLATVRSHASHALADADETFLCDDRRDGWTNALLAARPPLGTLAEADWYRAIDDDYATVRATLTRHLLDEPSAVGGRLAPRLSFYWYYRQQMVEASRWLQLGHHILSAGDPVDLLLAKIGLAAALALQGRVDLASPLVDEILGQLPDAAPERRVEIGEGLVGLAFAMWWRDEHQLVVEVHRQLTSVVDLTGSANLGLLADAVGCEALAVQGRPEESIGRARFVQERASAAGNLMASWLVAGPPVVVALLAAKPADGIPWWNSCVQDHLHFGTGAAGMFMETRADFAAQAGDYLEAARLYAVARAETRRAGMPWPRRPLSQELMTTTRDYLSRADYERAWHDGERLTMSEVVGSSVGTRTTTTTTTGAGLERPVPR
jgi:predicted ATPase/DNA-binding SARP family transcriptional activator